ncbi:MAG: ammonium transporter [Abditibacteriota bacterium]|nr:ammonium transporter [Abditibacteriota bacterium]
MNTGDTAFVLIASAMVFIMTPGLAFFYGGMVRRKNVINTMLSSFFICGLATALWIAVGYSLSFTGDFHGIIGSLKNCFLMNINTDPNPAYSSTIPETSFVLFQMMFSLITCAIITGSVMGRMKFSALFLFIVFWLFLVYYPLAHMVWGEGGFLKMIGSLDFAGGNVVHISSGIAGLTACLVVGKRRGHGMLSYNPHNIPFVLLGAALLWFGWIGFNAGSALGANELACHAFITTSTSAAVAMLSWMFIEKVRRGKVTLLGSATGAVLGLVAITPGAGFVPIWSSFLIGLFVSPICYLAIGHIKRRFQYDDALDAFGCHGVGGIYGGIVTGLFATKTINPDIMYNGLFFGDYKLILVQIFSIIVSILLSGVMTFIILKVMSVCRPIRVSEKNEDNGLDVSEHGESAYPSFLGLD